MGIRFSQIVLVTVALVCLAFSHALTDRNQTTYESLTSVIGNLKQLRDNKAISGDEFYAIKDRLDPLMRPVIHDPWLLRNTLGMGCACLFLSSLLSMFGIRWKSRTLLLERETHQAAGNG
ncbi:hypothetical protein GCM10023212_19230 [Luteolibacter yonseiensis]